MNRIDRLQISGFGFGRRLVVAVHGNAETTQLSHLAVDDADRNIDEVDPPGAPE
ncbi:MAG: hypothetical protein ACLQIQ_06500 [Beijerinckiaceae bacterium]